jgi:hypothetical protein
MRSFVTSVSGLSEIKSRSGHRATAELPSFHGVSRKKLLACPATQMQSGDGTVGTDNQQAVDGENQRARARWPTYMRSTGFIWKEPGYKVAWIERGGHAARRRAWRGAV